MSYSITENARAVLRSKNLTPILVLNIEGYGDILTTTSIEEVARYGNPGLVFGQPGLVYGGSNKIENQRSLISLNGTTTKITQQLLQDEGASTSTQNITVALVNKDNAFSDLVTPVGNNDVISKRATIYLGVEGFVYPEDYLRIFVGNVTGITMNGGIIKVTVSHPENEKRFDLFTQAQTNLNGAITNSATTITVDDTSQFLVTQDLLFSYIRIDNEIISYTGKTATTFTGCVRGQLGTAAATHADDANVASFYVLGDSTAASNAIDLALKVLISQAGIYLTATPSTIGSSPDPLTVNSFFIPDIKAASDLNVQVGDLLTSTGATTPGNNLVNAVITAVIEEVGGSRLVVANTLTAESGAPATVTLKSQYDTLPDGVGLSPDQVDIAEFRRIFDLFSSSLVYSRIYLRDTISGKDLLNKEILFPSACYSIPRKGQVSVGKTKPPIAESETKTLDETNVLNAGDLSITRSSLENFYNAVIYRYEEDVLTERFLAGRVTLSATSTARIKVGNKPYLIQAKGIRKTADNESIISNNSQRILDRYQFGAEMIKGVQVSFSTGWTTEIGDTVVVQGLKIQDSKTGERELSPRIMEIANRGFEFRKGVIELDLLDTAFALDGRYGVLSPSSLVGTGSTATEVIITRSFGTSLLQQENFKWLDYLNLKVQIHRPDWSVVGSAVLLGFDPTNTNKMLLGAGLGFTPQAGDIVDIEPYDTAPALYKSTHVYFTPKDLITVDSVNQDEITVATPAVYFNGAIIKVHSATFTNQSIEAIVTGIAGSVLTLDRDLGYLPVVNDEVDLIGFVSDNGLPYRIL